MKKAKREKIQRGGFKITTVKEFFNLSDEETALIDMKIRLMRKLREVRTKSGVTQKELAKMMGTSQSRIAMLEGGAADVSLDLLCKALFSLGVTARQLGGTIAAKSAA